jgi:phenylacetic acid degradation operon negative regulatory protein
MRAREIVSSLREVRTSRFIFSSLSFYGQGKKRELPGPWFTSALTRLGLEEMAVRQTLYRMERDRELSSRKEGRVKIYRPTPTTVAIIDAGTAKMRGASNGGVSNAPRWDGLWTLVRLHSAGSATDRERLRDILMVEGFAALGDGWHIHPRDRADRIVAAVAGTPAAKHFDVIRGARTHSPLADREFVASLWDLSAIAKRYEQFLSRFGPLTRHRARWDPREAAGIRFALVFHYLEVAWNDPGFPAELLPAEWPATRAQALVDGLYETLTSPAREFGDAVMREVGVRAT